MRTLLRKLLRNLFGPRSVDSCVSRISRAVDDLNHSAEANQQVASDLRREAAIHQFEADRARTVADRLDQLIR